MNGSITFLSHSCRHASYKVGNQFSDFRETFFDNIIDADNNADLNGWQETSNVNLDTDQVVDTSGPKLPPKPQDFVAVKLLPASECEDTADLLSPPPIPPKSGNL